MLALLRFYLKSVAIDFHLWYYILATQVNNINPQGCILYFGKNALSLLHPLRVVTLASRQLEAVHFSGV